MGGEIIFLIPMVLGFAAVATIGGVLLLWLIWIGARRWGPPSWRTGSVHFPFGITTSVLIAASLPVGCAWACQPVPQPESRRTVSAYEVPLSTAADRAEFLSILSSEAAAEGLEVRIETDEEMARWAEMSPELSRTIGAIVYRNGDIGATEANISDAHHDGHTWISFTRGEDPALAQRFRDRLMLRIIERWPEVLSVPVAQTGALPHRRDLVRGDQGYEIDPARLAGYMCGTAPGNAPPSACE